jgi:hypothetical protein
MRMLRMLISDVVPGVNARDISGMSLRSRPKERGTIAVRAAFKTRAYWKELAQIGREREIDAVLSTDDGLCVSGEGVSANTWQVTSRILRGEWPIGTPVVVVRAVCLQYRDEYPRFEEIRSRFTYVGRSYVTRHIRDTYPLSNVLAAEGSSVAIIDIPEEERHAMYLRLAPCALSRLFYRGSDVPNE